ncbi:vacuolar protein sorting protein [Naviculisporaceae sp. PSN 640]
MFLKQVDLTTALRPSYLPDEDLIFVQDNVGLYEGKYKLPNHQNGAVYLTSHRICYVDKAEPRRYSVAIDLKDVDRYEFYAGFLKSSAKITLVPKAAKRSSLQPRSPALSSFPSRTGSGTPNPNSSQTTESQYRAPPVDPTPTTTATWVCTICTFSNPVPSNFDPSTATAHTPLPPCLACGIKPTLAHVLKATISNATSRQPVPSPALYTPLPVRPKANTELSAQVGGGSLTTGTPRASPQASDPDASFQCPRCTFLNHPSLLSCEICGAPLISHDIPSQISSAAGNRSETDSPGPFLNSSLANLPDTPAAESIKLSFRGGGEKIFYQRLKDAMTQRKWLLHGAPPIPKSSSASTDRSLMSTNNANSSLDSSVSQPSDTAPQRAKIAGIAGLEHHSKAMRKNNELVIGSAFEDLEALMASAKEIVALAETFARQVNKGKAGGGSTSESALLAESASQLGLITTKDIVGSSSGSKGESLYLTELARTLAEFLSDDARGVLKRAGGIISLVDLWAMFNRARGGVELVSPADFAKAANLFEKLGLPVRLRTFKSGVKVVQGSDRTDEHTIRALLSWLKDLHDIPPDELAEAGTGLGRQEVTWDWREFGRGVTARDVAERFGWSIGVAEEELEMAEERGVLCRDEGIEGIRFWENFVDLGEGKAYDERKKKEEELRLKREEEKIMQVLKEGGFI